LALDFNLLKAQKKYLLPIAAFLLSLHAAAQENPSKTPNLLDTKYEPDGMLFGNGRSKQNKEKRSEDIYAAVKYLPFDLLRGNVTIEGDLRVSNAFNITCGLGLNLFPNYLEKNYHFNVLQFLYDEPGINSISVQEALKYGSYHKNGIFFSLGYKNYTEHQNYFSGSGESFSGGYTFVKLSYFNYSILLPETMNGYPVSDQVFPVSTALFNMGIGYTLISNGKIPLVHDFYIGLGAKVLQMPVYALTRTSVSSTYVKKTPQPSWYFGALSLGYAIGFGL
jgi:hypothetical protein